MQEFYTLVTKIGAAAIANATILGQKVNITNFAVGDGAGNYYTPTAEMTELKREVWRGKPTSVEVDKENSNIMIVSTVIPAEIGGFTIREMALFTEDGKMIAISNCPELQKVTLGTGVASELALTMQIAVSNAETIEFKVDPTVIIATKSDVEKAKEELEMPTFDDSGTVPTIQSFTDFVNSIKSKMNIFEFYRNFKSGMKYILDTGRIVNNVATDREDMVLSAAMGKYLQEQITEQNNNLNGFYYNNTDVFEWANSIHKTRSASFSSSCTGLPTNSTFNVLRIEQGGNLATMLAIQEGTGKIFSSTYNTSIWCEWKEILTKDTFTFNNLTTDIFRKSENNRISNADTAPFGISVMDSNGVNNPFNFWSTLVTTGQEWYTQQLALPWSYADKSLKYRVKDSGVWSEWNTIISSDDIPIFDTFILNPNGATDVELILKHNTQTHSVYALNGDIDAYTGCVLGTKLVPNTNRLRILLSKQHWGNIRINVMYMKS